MSRPYDLVCFDLDGTLIQGTIFIWQTLHDHFHTDGERRRRAKEDFFAGRITYKQWFEHDLILLREADATRPQLLEALRPIRPTPGARETLDTLRSSSIGLAILSGSLDVVLERFFSDVVFDAVLINRLDFDDQGRIAGGTHTPYDVEHKGDGIVHLSQRLGIPQQRIAFVGDNFNDLSAARAAGLSIAFNPRSAELADTADVVITEPDLRTILPYVMG